MTEKQGGSDVRANTTRADARQRRRPGRRVPHRPATSGSAPRRCATLFLVLAQTDEGVSCFALPRILPDGSRNAFQLQRLKDKLGNRSNASSRSSSAAPGRACSARGPRRADDHRDGRPHAARLRHRLAPACGRPSRRRVHHAAHRARVRQAAHRAAADAERPRRPGVETEAATALAMRLARAYDERRPAAALRARDRGRQVLGVQARAGRAAEALECLGGNGYVEESGMPRLYREAPLNWIWEGSGNVIGLDVLRAMAATRRARRVLRRGRARPRRRRAPRRLRRRPARELTDLAAVESRARRVVERMALALQGSLLVRHAPPTSPTRSAPRGSAATYGPTSGRCRPTRRRAGDRGPTHAAGAGRVGRGHRGKRPVAALTFGCSTTKRQDDSKRTRHPCLRCGRKRRRTQAAERTPLYSFASLAPGTPRRPCRSPTGRRTSGGAGRPGGLISEACVCSARSRSGSWRSSGRTADRTARCQPTHPCASRRRRLAHVVMKVSSASFMTRNTIRTDVRHSVIAVTCDDSPQ